jgi:hypothetical protein
MPKKVTTKARKVKASRTSKSKSSKAVSKTTKTAGSLSQKSAGKKYIERSSVSGKFVSAKTGRVVKTSPTKPRLGRERIQTVVRSYVRGDGRTRRFAA